MLKEACDRAIDEEEKPLDDFKHVHSYIMKDTYRSVLKCMRKAPLVGRFFNKYLYHYLSFCYDCAINFREGHTRAQKILPQVGQFYL